MQRKAAPNRLLGRSSRQFPEDTEENVRQRHDRGQWASWRCPDVHRHVFRPLAPDRRPRTTAEAGVETLDRRVRDEADTGDVLRVVERAAEVHGATVLWFMRAQAAVADIPGELQRQIRDMFVR